MSDRHRSKGFIIRADDELRDRFTGACAEAGSDRSAVLRQFMRWYVRESGATLPERPAGESYGTRNS